MPDAEGTEHFVSFFLVVEIGVQGGNASEEIQRTSVVCKFIQDPKK